MNNPFANIPTDLPAALANPRHERHEELRDWGGDFDAEKFDPKVATKNMKRGLPDW